MLPPVAMESEASHMLEAALEQMDDIIAGSKVVAAEFSNGLYDLGSPISAGSLQVVQIAEDLKLALELQQSQEERDSLRAQLPAETAQALVGWLQSGAVNLCSPSSNETYQERLLRLEGDKESLVLQVSVLTDQVEAQGEKIRDLESSLEEHHQKLVSTEEMLQQELLSRTSLESQKLDLMDEVSCLKLKLVSVEETQPNTHPQDHRDTKQNKAECVVNLISDLQEEMCRFQEEITTRIRARRALEEKEGQEGDPAAGQAAGWSTELGLGGSEPAGGHMHPGGQNVHDLMQEVRHLKGKVEVLEGERTQYERKLRATKLSHSSHVCYQSLVAQLSSLRLTVEHTQLQKQQCEERCRSAQAEMSELQYLLSNKDAEIDALRNELLARGSSANDRAKKDQEFHRLKRGMESLLASNDEKDRQIEELTILLGQYRKFKEIMALTQGSSDEELDSSLMLRALTHKAHSEISSSGSSPLLVSSTPFQRELDFSCRSMQNSLGTSLVSSHDASFLNGSWSQHRMLSISLEELQSGSLQKGVEIQMLEAEPANRAENPHMELSKYKTLPGKLNRRGGARAERNGDGEGFVEEPSPGQRSPVHRLEQDYKHRLMRPEKEESILSEHSPLSSGVDSGQQSPVSPEARKSHTGIRKLWGKIRRSQSGSPVQTDDPELGEFKRGGFRATAGPRLSRPGNTRDLHTPFSKWTTEQVCDWLEEMGLGQYAVHAQRWVSSGQTLLSATPHDLEKEMGVKTPLHRKKLLLAVKTVSSARPEKSAELDYIWVTRWLDDIGLPQYKDQFNEGRVDGQMLKYLTVNDLLFLKVTSQLHHLSIKCAIHVLHVNKFNPNCLKRRPSKEHQTTPGEVVQWSNHRVMEWLRSVDLAEYAPNLRGSGVHGGLLILEPRFSSDTLAMLLNIPPQKTLLRRHLATNFGSLVGAQAQQEKREFTEAANCSPLNPTAKVRPKKLVFSNLTHLRKKRPDDSTDYICPMDATLPPSGQPAVNGTHSAGLDQDDNCAKDQMVFRAGTILQIEALSKGINNLTDLLSLDEMKLSHTALV